MPTTTDVDVSLLPAELQYQVRRQYLMSSSPHSINLLGKCSKDFYCEAMPFLYRTLTINSRSEGLFDAFKFSNCDEDTRRRLAAVGPLTGVLTHFDRDPATRRWRNLKYTETVNIDKIPDSDLIAGLRSYCVSLSLPVKEIFMGSDTVMDLGWNSFRLERQFLNTFSALVVQPQHLRVQYPGSFAREGRNRPFWHADIATAALKRFCVKLSPIEVSLYRLRDEPAWRAPTTAQSTNTVTHAHFVPSADRRYSTEPTFRCQNINSACNLYSIGERAVLNVYDASSGCIEGTTYTQVRDLLKAKLDQVFYKHHVVAGEDLETPAKLLDRTRFLPLSQDPVDIMYNSVAM